MSERRIFTPAEDAVIRGAHAGGMHMRKVAKALNAGLGAIYRRMEELDLPQAQTRQQVGVEDGSMSASLPGLEMPPHPGQPNMRALELAYDGLIPLEAKIGADLADGRLHDAWVKQTRAGLVRYALREAYEALKDSSENALMRRAGAAGIVAAVLSHPEMQEA